MYAIVETSGKQYRVEPGRWITVDRMDGEEGDTISLDRVLMIGGESGPRQMLTSWHKRG